MIYDFRSNVNILISKTKKARYEKDGIPNQNWIILIQSNAIQAM